MPTPEQEAKKRAGDIAKRGGNVNPRKRKENAETLEKLPTTTVPHPIDEHERRCPHCGDEVKPIGAGDTVRRVRRCAGPSRTSRARRRGRPMPVQDALCTRACTSRVQEGCKYGPAFPAKLAVDKCADSTPIYRVEKAMRRAGIPISRSNLNDLVLLAADALVPLWRAAHDEMRVDGHVQADETSCRMQTFE